MFVSNTSTLILLAKAGALSIFLDDAREIIIPKIVCDEIKNKDSFEVLLIEKEIKNNRIKIIEVDKKYYEHIIKQFKLDDGEAAAYCLFKKEKGKAVLTDDRELIKLCRIENIPFIVAMAVIVRLFKKGKMKNDEAISQLKKLYGYGRYSKEIYEHFKSEVK